MTHALAFAAGCALRVTAILMIGWAIAAAMKGQSSARRHAMWLVTIVGALLVPVATLLVPRVTVASISAPSSPLARFVVEAGVQDETNRPVVQAVTREAAAIEQRQPSVAMISLPIVIAITWMTGVLVIALRSLFGVLRVRRMLARATTIDDGRISLFIDRAAGPGWRGRIRVAESVVVETPLSTSVGRHSIVLPLSHTAWSDRKLQLVLAHETAHITRHDCVTHFAATILTAFHWFNPLAWRAARALRTESEHACDDRALNIAVEPVAYAELLVAFAASSGRAYEGALPMAGAIAELETRLNAIIDSTKRRDPCSTRRHVIGGLCGAIIVMLIVTPQISATPIDVASSPRPSLEVRTARDELSSSAAARIEPTRTIAADTGSDDERLALSDDVWRAARAATQTLTGADSLLATALFGAIDHVPQHSLDLVHERAAWALARSRGTALVAPLVDALSSANWREAAYAAWALGVSRDGRAVMPLIGALTHDAWRVRANAAAALHQLGDPRATDAMRTSLGDGAWQVRAEAVQFLGRVGDTQPLRKMLQDTHVAVRSAAESYVTDRSR